MRFPFRQPAWLVPAAAAMVVAALAAAPPAAAQSIMDWAREFPLTDFSRSQIPFGEITFDGARRDSIPPIHEPVFRSVAEVEDIGDLEPVISVELQGEARAYPLRMMLWHEIVNDRIGEIPLWSLTARCAIPGWCSTVASKGGS